MHTLGSTIERSKLHDKDMVENVISRVSELIESKNILNMCEEEGNSTRLKVARGTEKPGNNLEQRSREKIWTLENENKSLKELSTNIENINNEENEELKDAHQIHEMDQVVT